MLFVKQFVSIFPLLLVSSAMKIAKRSAAENGSGESDAIFESTNDLVDSQGSKLQKRDKVGPYVPNFQRIPQNSLPFNPVDHSLIDFSQVRCRNKMAFISMLFNEFWRDA